MSAWERDEREEREEESLAPGATRARGSGTRAIPEEPDPLRTCFERDRDRILHCTAFRRLAGKTQVFIFPDDHQRTRLTHALEVAQVAVAVARALRLNVALTEAIALGHDCGHGPGGHASEEALSPFLEEGFDHAVWGADVVLSPLNLCAETLDGVRNHSWKRPACRTPEGAVVSWADRVAYTCHDLEDAVKAGIITSPMIPRTVTECCGPTRREQLRSLIASMVGHGAKTGQVGMADSEAEALGVLRAFNFERIYLRPASLAQARVVVEVLRTLVAHFSDRPNLIAGSMGPELEGEGVPAGSKEAVRAAVHYVAGMTDRFALRQARAHLGGSFERMAELGFES